MGTPFPGPPFLQSGIPRPQGVLFPQERTIPRWKIVLPMGMQGPGPQISSLVRVITLHLAVALYCYCLWLAGRILLWLKFSNELVNLYLDKKHRGPAAKLKRGPQIFTGGPGIFTIPTTLNWHFNPCSQLYNIKGPVLQKRLFTAAPCIIYAFRAC